MWRREAARAEQEDIQKLKVLSGYYLDVINAIHFERVNQPHQIRSNKWPQRNSPNGFQQSLSL